MNVSVSELTNAVLMLLDENRVLLETRITYCDPGTDLISLVRRLLPEAARLESAEAEAGDISEGLPLEAPLGYDGDGVATARLPAGFMRLLYLRMSDWSDGLTQTLSAAQVPLLRATARRRSARRHRGIHLRHGGDGRVLDIYGSLPGAAIAEASYLPRPEIAGDLIFIPSSLVERVERRAAASVRETLTQNN